MCNESNDSDEEAEANNVLNELNDLILNMQNKEDNDGFEFSSDVEIGSIGDEKEECLPELAMPRIQSLLDNPESLRAKQEENTQKFCPTEEHEEIKLHVSDY